MEGEVERRGLDACGGEGSACRGHRFPVSFQRQFFWRLEDGGEEEEEEEMEEREDAKDVCRGTSRIRNNPP